ncbi:MAG: hypothetical protein GY737_00875 [Desulfobacteraceae bacterium]|nr:hypothetical protein [Desulfobacteraceae bacterium]
MKKISIIVVWTMITVLPLCFLEFSTAHAATWVYDNNGEADTKGVQNRKKSKRMNSSRTYIQDRETDKGRILEEMDKKRGQQKKKFESGGQGKKE